MGPSASRRLVGFCRTLRHAGISVTIGEELDLSRALLALRDPSPLDFRNACRVTLLKDPGQGALFDALFDAYWSRDAAIQMMLEDELSRPRPGMTQVPRGAELIEAGGPEPPEERTGADIARAVRAVLYSSDAPARARVLRGIERERIREMQRRARHLRRRVATLPGRRFRAAAHGDVDLRMAARRSLRYAGEWVDLPLRTRRLRRTRLLIVWDVSGSMEERHGEHLGLVYALQKMGRTSRVFAFGTDLYEITPYLRAQPYPTVVARMSSVFTSWGGGTRIGESLAKLNRECASWIDRHTVVLILSDGWDVGNLDLLRREMTRLRRRCGLLLWLDPNAADPDFRPEVAGLRAALPYVDLLLSTEVLSSARTFRRELGPSLTSLA